MFGKNDEKKAFVHHLRNQIGHTREAKWELAEGYKASNSIDMLT